MVLRTTYWLVTLGLLLFGAHAVSARGGKTEGAVHVVADFEGDLEAQKVEAVYAKGARGESEQRSGQVLEIRTDKGPEWSEVRFENVPADITKMRTLRFWAKGDGDPSHEIYVRLYDQNDEYLVYRIDAPGKEWKHHDLRIGRLPVSRTFRPTQVKELTFIWFSPKKAYSLHLDDIHLVEGEGGWRLSEKEQAAHIFGEKRVRKVKAKKTKHFTIWMDTKAAAKKFPKALEAAYDRVRKMLALDEMEGRLPVYIFQNPNGYWDFCQRHLGWPRASAENSAGHGSSRYFATYYQGKKTPTVTHELTHSMVHRVLGWGGGSWFQEGAAVYCEDLDNGRSAAKAFSPSVRGGRFMPLRQFISTARLIDSEDVRGGAASSDKLYAQAGAFFEFLLRSKTARAPDAKAKDGEPYVGERIKKLADLTEEGDELVKAVEKIYGMPIEELEKAWVAWGSKPPKAKR